MTTESNLAKSMEAELAVPTAKATRVATPEVAKLTFPDETTKRLYSALPNRVKADAFISRIEINKKLGVAGGTYDLDTGLLKIREPRFFNHEVGHALVANLAKERPGVFMDYAKSIGHYAEQAQAILGGKSLLSAQVGDISEAFAEDFSRYITQDSRLGYKPRRFFEELYPKGGALPQAGPIIPEIARLEGKPIPSPSGVPAEFWSQVTEGMTLASDEEFGTSLMDWLTQMEDEGSPGFVMPKTEPGPCTCHDIDGGLCFKRGVIGPLSKEQKTELCTSTTMSKDGIRTRVEKFRGAVKACQVQIKDIAKGERLKPWLDCMSRELALEGITTR